MIGRQVTIWEIIWTGGLPHLSGLTHLHGIPHLLVNRPLEGGLYPREAWVFFLLFTGRWACNWRLNYNRQLIIITPYGGFQNQSFTCSLKDINGKGKFSWMLTFLLSTKESCWLWNRPSRNSTMFSSRRSEKCPVLKFTKGSEGFFTLWSRKLRFTNCICRYTCFNWNSKVFSHNSGAPLPSPASHKTKSTI